MLIIRAHHQNETMKTVIVLLVSISSEGLISTQKSYHEGRVNSLSRSSPGVGGARAAVADRLRFPRRGGE